MALGVQPDQLAADWVLLLQAVRWQAAALGAEVAIPGPLTLVRTPSATISPISIRASVQTRMAVGQVGVRMIFADASKFVSCARFMGMRTLGRFEGEEIAAKGCFDRGSKRPTPPRNRSGGSPSRPAARADAR